MRKLIITILMAGAWIAASAQQLSGEDVKLQFVKDWQRARAYTLEYLNAVPADRYSFRPTDSVRNFAQQMLHLAATNVFFISTATGQTIDWPGVDHDGSKIPQQKDSVVYYVLKSYDFAIAAIGGFDPAKFGEVVGPARIRATRFAYLLKGFEHQTHHRGQTTVYIRLMGIRPPGEKLF
jgi:uncharacterized damage-inducible protein DinB